MRPFIAATGSLSVVLLKSVDGIAFSAFYHNHHRSFSALCPSHQHLLLPLPCPSTIDAEHGATITKKLSPGNIQNALLGSNINKIAFIRHGNTSSAAVDFDRALTDLGRTQSRAARASFGIEELYPYYKKGAICSSAPRCVETAQLFLDLSSQKVKDGAKEECKRSSPPIKLYSELYDGTMQPEGSRLFRSIGYAPLRKYLMNQNELDAEAARCVLGGYAHVSLNVILDIVAKDNQEEIISTKANASSTGETLLFFAHAIYLPSAALAFATSVGCGCRRTGNDGVDLILDTNTEEAEGYCVNVDTKTVSLLSRPEDMKKSE